jgi:hypothetical protein
MEFLFIDFTSIAQALSKSLARFDNTLDCYQTTPVEKQDGTSRFSRGKKTL